MLKREDILIKIIRHIDSTLNEYEQILEEKELKICELNTKLCRAEGTIDKIKNMYRILTGEELE